MVGVPPNSSVLQDEHEYSVALRIAFHSRCDARLFGVQQILPTIRRMLDMAFTKSELEVLSVTPKFIAAAQKAASLDDFRSLCEMAEEILTERGLVNRSASQLRKSSFSRSD